MTLLISLHSFVVLNRLFDGHLQAAILKTLTLPYLSTEWAESGEFSLNELNVILLIDFLLHLAMTPVFIPLILR